MKIKGFLVLAFLIFLHRNVFSQFYQDTSFYNTDGIVNDVLIDKDTMYLGGNFNYFGPVNPNNCLINTSNNLPYLFPKINTSYVYAAVSDLNGGWYVGGNFDTIGGVRRPSIAHVFANGVIDSWNPGTDGAVNSIAVTPTQIIIGGNFSLVAGQSRQNFAVFNKSTGNLTSFNISFGNITKEVRSILVNNSTAYVGGTFDSVNFQPHMMIAKVNLSSNTVSSWNPQADGGFVTAMKFYKNYILVAGNFSTFQSGAITSVGFCKLDTTTAIVNTSFLAGGDGIKTMEITGNDLFYGGSTSTGYGFISRYNLITDTVYSSWMPLYLTSISSVNGICKTNHNLTVAGDFNLFGNYANLNNLVFLDTINFNIIDSLHQPGSNNVINLLSYDAPNHNLFVSGDFTSCGGQVRHDFVKYNLAQNTIDPLAVGLYRSTAVSINTISKNGGYLYLGGVFDSILYKGAAWNFAEIEISTGNLTSWRPNPNGPVSKLLQSNNKLIIGGDYSNISGQPRNNFSVMDLTTHSLNSSSFFTTYPITDMAINGTSLFVVEKWNTLYKVGLNGFAQLGYSPNFYALPGVEVINSIQAYKDKLAVAGGFSTINGQSISSLTLLDTAMGTNIPTFNANVQGEVTKLFIQNDLCFTYGIFTDVLGMPRNDFAIINLQTTSLLGNDVLAGENIGAVSTFAVDKDHLYFFGQFTEPVPFYYSSNIFFEKRKGYLDFDIIKGLVFNDANANNIKDANEKGIANAMINFNSGAFYTATDSTGYYNLRVDIGNYVLSPVLPVNYSTLSTPSGQSASFATLGVTDSLNNFALQLQNNVTDVAISIANNSITRIGYDFYYTIAIKNLGSDVQNGSASFIFTNSGVTYVSSIPAYTSLSGQTYYWNYANLIPGEERNIKVRCHINFTAISGSSIIASATITNSGTDVLPSNNTDNLSNIIISSFDPNYKEVNPAGTGPNGDVPLNTPKFDYTVHFQNTGTDTAINIVVTDTLSNMLDLNTFVMLSSSHTYWYEINDRVLKVYFQNIKLPDSTVNEVFSHAFFKYSIKPLNTVVSGDIVKNTAFIYFDFNCPVKTNSTINTFNAGASIYSSGENESACSVYPNPSTGEISVSASFLVQSLVIYNTLGEIVFNTVEKEKNFTINLGHQTPGVYLICIKDENLRLSYRKIIIR